jgi:hypothetical protein
MKRREFLLICSALALCAAGAVSPGRAQDKDWFDAGTSLEQTVAWLGRQLTHVRRVASANGKYVRRYETRQVKAKGCTLIYTTSTQTDNASLDTATGATEYREVWHLDLSGLDPSRISVVDSVAGAEKVVWFRSAPGARNAIRSSAYHNDMLRATYSNKRFGKFSVRDERLLPQVAAALAHAVELCRERKQ